MKQYILGNADNVQYLRHGDILTQAMLIRDCLDAPALIPAGSTTMQQVRMWRRFGVGGLVVLDGVGPTTVKREANQ